MDLGNFTKDEDIFFTSTVTTVVSSFTATCISKLKFGLILVKLKNSNDRKM